MLVSTAGGCRVLAGACLAATSDPSGRSAFVDTIRQTTHFLKLITLLQPLHCSRNPHGRGLLFFEALLDSACERSLGILTSRFSSEASSVAFFPDSLRSWGEGSRWPHRCFRSGAPTLFCGRNSFPGFQVWDPAQLQRELTGPQPWEDLPWPTEQPGAPGMCPILPSPPECGMPAPCLSPLAPYWGCSSYQDGLSKTDF